MLTQRRSGASWRSSANARCCLPWDTTRMHAAGLWESAGRLIPSKLFWHQDNHVVMPAGASAAEAVPAAGGGGGAAD